MHGLFHMRLTIILRYTSSNAAQTARDVYKYYFSNKNKKDKARKKVSGAIKMPESSTTHID